MAEHVNGHGSPDSTSSLRLALYLSLLHAPHAISLSVDSGVISIRNFSATIGSHRNILNRRLGEYVVKPFWERAASLAFEQLEEHADAWLTSGLITCRSRGPVVRCAVMGDLRVSQPSDRPTCSAKMFGDLASRSAPS